jgi:hypothetical protein
LVVPFVDASISELLYIDHFKRPVQDVQVSFVWKLFDVLLRRHVAKLTAENAEVAEKIVLAVLSVLRVFWVNKTSLFAVEIIAPPTFNDRVIGR